ncbi:MAG: hypothetical protein AAF488_09430 [Planctomycetota bacterium]
MKSETIFVGVAALAFGLLVGIVIGRYGFGPETGPRLPQGVASAELREQSKRTAIMGPFAILALLVIGAMPLFFTGTPTASVNVNSMHQAESSTQALINH